MFVISYNVCCKFVYLITLREKYLVLSIQELPFVYLIIMIMVIMIMMITTTITLMIKIHKLRYISDQMCFTITLHKS